MGGTANDYGSAVTVDPSGNVYSAGSFSGTADFDPSSAFYNLTAQGSGDMYLSKLDASGSFVWVKRTSCNAAISPLSLCRDASGNLIAAGQLDGLADFEPGSPNSPTLQSTPGFDSDAFIAKWDAAGQIVWAKNIGGASLDYAQEAIVDASGNIYVCGMIEGTADLDPGIPVYTVTTTNSNRSGFVVKLDASGNFVWGKTFTGTSVSMAVCRHMCLNTSGELLITGSYLGTVDFDPGTGTQMLTSKMSLFGNSQDVFIAKLDASGNYLWAGSVGSNSEDYGTELITDGLDNIYLTGAFQGTIDLDPSAATYTVASNGGYDIFVCKISRTGGLVWGGGIGGGNLNYDEGSAITFDVNGDLLVSGFYSGTADFDIGSATQNVSSPMDDKSNGFILKMDTSGSFNWVKILRGKSYSACADIFTDTGGNIYTTGYYHDTTDFDPGSPLFNMNPVGGYDIFVLKLSQPIATGVTDLKEERSLIVYPNPTGSYLMLSNTKETFEYSIYDQTGRVVSSGKLNNAKEQIYVGNLAKGVYFVREKEQGTGYKFLKE